MRINIVFVLSVLSVLSSFCGAQVTTDFIEQENDENCTEEDLNCLDNGEGDQSWTNCVV